MQLALHPSATAGLHLTAPWVARRNRILIGSVAALSASVIAVGPAVQNGATLELHQVQQRAVQLVADVTDSPAAVYGDLINNTVYDVSTLLKQYAAQPFPILSAIVSNQVGYLKRIFDFSSASTAFNTWWNVGTRESPAGKTLLASVQSALASGNIGVAYENFNKLALFGVQNTVLPWLNSWFLGTATNPSIFTQMAQNLTNASAAFFTTGTLVFGAFQGLYSPVSGAAFAVSRALSAVGSALGSGNVVGAVTALVNTPGVVLDAFLNGFDYDGSGATNPWAGLLSPKDPNCTGRCAGGGPISQFFITIAQKIAAAIKNVAPATTAVTATTVAATTATTTTADVASATVVPASNTVTLTVTDTADKAVAATESAAAAAESNTATTEKAATDEAAAPSAIAAENTDTTTDAPKTDTTAAATKADSSKADTTAGDTKTDASGTDSAGAHSGKADSAKADSAKASSGKADSTNSGNNRGHNGGTAKADSTKADSGNANSTKADASKAGTHQRGTKHADTSHSSEGSSSSGGSSK